jgi:uncharacterized protein with PIN domain
VPGSYGVATFVSRIWISLTSPVARLRAHERRKMEKITALDERVAGFEAALRESMAAVEKHKAGLESSLQDGITTLATSLLERMTALETALQSCPGEACPYCGERTLRLKKASGPIGSGRGTWRRETWVCEACGKEDWRHRNYPD